MGQEMGEGMVCRDGIGSAVILLDDISFLKDVPSLSPTNIKLNRGTMAYLVRIIILAAV